MFRLYPEDASWWTFYDYGNLLALVRAYRPRRVLEFGPGGSTLALIEGGAEAVDSCEDDPEWSAIYRERLEAKHPSIVRIIDYTLVDPLVIPELSDIYDFAFVDGPRTTLRRPDVVRFALERAPVVACHDWRNLAKIMNVEFRPLGSIGVLVRC